ncbi:MAG TPA: M48 family metalloprotease [Candidatus Acidoferrum sp.]|nr:M48 family metalloprotease [Candidatus Acidoferrum sp.]
MSTVTMEHRGTMVSARRAVGIMLALTLTYGAPAGASNKVKLHGYITARLDDKTVQILDDRLETTALSHVFGQDGGGEHPMRTEELSVGMLVDAEGQWLDRHKFFAEKITVDLRESDKKIHGTAYLQEEPADTNKIAAGQPGQLKLDGYLLEVGGNTKREWNVTKVTGSSSGGSAAAGQLAACHVKYTATLRKDGRMDAEQIDLEPPASADAYKMPHDIQVVRAKDAQTGINILEFRQGKKVQGRLKLLEERSVQEYVSHLGDSLLPAGAEGTSRRIEFRFFVVEDPEINAASLPDGTMLINTGLLGAIQNESQLAFLMSHEIAHVLQAHYKREVDETRGQRVGLTIAGIVAGAFIGDVGLFMAGMGIASVVNGHQRELENQADRLGLQNVIEHGYDPREAPNFSRLIINRYGDRTTSKLWSNHDSSVIRGSFLTIQLQRAYPDHNWEGTKKNTKAFEEMKEDLGPVKVM